MNHDPAINKLLRTIKNTKSGKEENNATKPKYHHHNRHHNHHHLNEANEFHHTHSAVETFSSTSLSSLQSARSNRGAISTKCATAKSKQDQHLHHHHHNHEQKRAVHPSLLKTHPLFSKERDLSMFKARNKCENKQEKDEDDDDDDDEDDDERFKLVDDNNNNNKYRWATNKKAATAQKETVSAYFDDDICSSSAIKNKLHRANKVFYNGFLDKRDKLKQHSAEQQAHAAELQHFLKSLWLTKTMCDLNIVCGGQKYPAHKLALAMYSRKYRDEFEKHLHLKDSSVYTICLKNSSPFAVEAIIKYIYTGKIDINPANIEEILATAQELGIDDLICMSQDYLASLSIGDILDYMRNMFVNGTVTTKDGSGSELMLYELYVYMMTHLDKISRTPEYLKSSARVVRALLGDSHLCVHSEMDVFEAVMRWIEFDKSARLKCLYETLKCVRLTLISPDDLLAKVEPRLVALVDVESDKIYRLLFNAYKYHALSRCQTSLLIKKDDARNVCLKGASVPERFVDAIHELSNIAHKLKSVREQTTNKLLD